jgi:hypothetical protein
LGLTEVAYQNALAYAKDRVQMRSLTGVKAPGKPADPIIVHPDVRRMLMTAKAYAEGGRALACFGALLLDKELNHPDEAVRAESAELLALLTPIVKAFTTDNAWQATTECQQVFGGHGYIKEWGMEQFVRDARINMIYEGTNTIQSLDLLGRKVLGNQGASLKKFGKLVEQLVKAEMANEAMGEFIKPLADLGQKLTQITGEVLRRWIICAWWAIWCWATSGPDRRKSRWPNWPRPKKRRSAPTRSTKPSCKRRVFTSHA